MTSREIIKRLIAHDAPPRFGFDFKDRSDIELVDGRWGRWYIGKKPNKYDAWDYHEELARATHFTGETRTDLYGNIYGRFNGEANGSGECIKGALTDGWELFEQFELPELSPAYKDHLMSLQLDKADKFIMLGGNAVFAQLRDIRLLENAMVDILVEPEMVDAFLEMTTSHEVEIIHQLGDCGADAMMIWDDWGTQVNTFISAETFREVFKPHYKRIADALHEHGMKYIVHSCGANRNFLPDFVDAGIDVLQFDQPDIYPAEFLAENYGDKVVFFSPVDIQRVLPTGDRALIEKRALEMCEIFRGCRGSWIAKDYPTYETIGVDPAWARWAEDVIIANSAL